MLVAEGYSMYTLIVNGSPRPNGDTAALIRAFCGELPGEWEILNVRDGKTAPCLDCRRCHTREGCALRDGMDEFWPRLQRAGLLVFASPVYYGQPSGQLLSWATRLQYAFVSAHIRRDPDFSLGKRLGAVLLAAGGGTKDPEPALRTMRMLLRECGAEYAGFAAAMQTDRLPAREDAAALDGARRLARELAARLEGEQFPGGI